MVQAVSPLRPLRMGFVVEKVAQDLVFFPLSLSFHQHSVFTFHSSTIDAVGRDSVVGIATPPRAGRSGNRIPVGARFSAPVQACPGAHAASYTVGAGSLSRG